MSESHNESKSSNKPSFVARHPLLSILGAGVIAGAGVLAGSEYLKTDKEREAIEASREVAEALKAIPAAKAEEARKVGEALGKAQKAADEAKEGVTKLDEKVQKGHEDAAKRDEDEAKKRKEMGDKLGTGIQGLQAAIDAGLSDLKGKADEAARRLAASEEATRKLRERSASHRAGIDYECSYLNDFSLTRQPTANGEVITLFNADGRALRRIDLKKYSDAEIEIVHRRDDDVDGDFDETYGGLFVDVDGGEDKATGVMTELEAVIKLLDNSTDRHTNADELHANAQKLYTAADTAYKATDTSYTAAGTSYKAADKAHKDAVKAAEDAAKEVADAGKAYKAVEEAIAGDDADKKKQAEEAKPNVIKRQEAAAKAKKEADEATTKAEEASTKAEEAKKKAEENRKKAEEARKKAKEGVDTTTDGRRKAKETFDDALKRFEKIGRDPTHGLIKPEARALVELFRDAGEKGIYLSATRVASPGEELGLPHVAIERIDPNNYRIHAAGKDPVKELVVEKFGRRSARVRLVSHRHSGVEKAESKTMKLTELKALVGDDVKAGKTYTLYGGALAPLREVVVESVTADDASVKVITYNVTRKTTEKRHTMPRSDLEKMFDSPGAGKRYTLFSKGTHLLGEIEVEDHPTRRDYKKVTVTRGGLSNTYEVPTTYVEEMAKAWEAANLNGKDDSLKIRMGMASIASAITNLENVSKRHESHKEDYDRGVKWRGTFSEDGENTSNAVRVAGGGEDRDYSADAYQEKTSVTMDNGDATEGSVENLNLDFNFRLGSTPTTAGDTRALFRLSLFGEASSEDSTMAATAPNVNVDGTGRFETTEEYLGGTEGKDSDHVSVGFYSKWNDEEFFRAGIFGGSNRLKWHHETDVTIRDLSDTSGSGDFTNHAVADGISTDDYWGLSLTAGIADSTEDHAVVPVFRLRKGTVTENDGTEMDYSGMDLGAFYRFVGDDCRLTVGGIWTSGEVDGVEYSEGDLSLHVPFKANDNLVIAPNVGVRLLDSSAQDANLWRGGIAIGAGGRGTASDTVNSFDRYALDRMLDEMSGQYTPAALSLRDHWRRIGMLQGMDSNLVFGVNAEEMYDAEGGPDTGIDAHLALMSQLSGNRKFILDLNYSNNPFGETVGAELGYFGKGNSLSVGYNHVNGKGGMPNDNVIVASATFRF